MPPPKPRFDRDSRSRDLTHRDLILRVSRGIPRLISHLLRISLVLADERGQASIDVRFMPAPTPTPERLTAVLAQVHKAVAAVTGDDDLPPVGYRQWVLSCTPGDNAALPASPTRPGAWVRQRPAAANAATESKVGGRSPRATAQP